MCTIALRPATRLVLLFCMVVITVAAAAGMVSAQVTCYRTKCLVYPDGMRICERTPVDCATLQL
jgi:hypothetical protein